MPSCIIQQCSSRTVKKINGDEVILHCFPKDFSEIKRWLRHFPQEFTDIDQLSKRILEQNKNNKFRLCSLHFSEESYNITHHGRVLRPDAVPTIFPSAEGELLMSESLHKSRPTKRKRCQEAKSKVNDEEQKRQISSEASSEISFFGFVSASTQTEFTMENSILMKSEFESLSPRGSIMSLYPSLEDLKVDKVIQAQTAFATNPATPAILSEASASSSSASQYGGLYPKLYPELAQYMGLSLSEDEIHKNMSMVPSAGMQVARPSAMNNMVAPVTGGDVGVRRAEIKQGLRELILCKDQDGKIGLRLKSIDNGIFVQLVQANSPASLAGLKFGDQVLQVNGENCAGWSSDKSHKFLKQAAGDKINVVIRDRPFERTITMHKDSSGHIGFIFKNGKITSIVKDSSAARNGLLTEHNLCEINGQNVIGLKDSQVADLLASSANVVTLTVMPSYIFEHMVKRMASSVLKSLMDHSIADV